MAEIIVTSENFKDEVLGSDIPVLLDFWAEWCGPCRMLSPVVAEIAEKYDGKIKVGKVNVDDEPELAQSFQVMNIPMLVVMSEKNIAGSAVGYRTFDQLEAMIRSV